MLQLRHPQKLGDICGTDESTQPRQLDHLQPEIRRLTVQVLEIISQQIQIIGMLIYTYLLKKRLLAPNMVRTTTARYARLLKATICSNL
ncbi:unnamed protein product [Strongylus vulgaris]|uniref:Uncharacterized protein n=1 Tax=Strongylus vulgaris TaxID=40348 RepID=A0A3P7K1E8_STRVU|nr:unnamed protein product [Strongylus vulgaris]